MDIPQFDVANWFIIPGNSPLADNIRTLDERAAVRHERIEAERKRKAIADELDLGKQAPPGTYSLIDLTALPVIDTWIESNVYDFSKVNPTTLDVSNAPLLSLEEYQRRILRHIFPPGGYKGRLSKYTTVLWSQPKKSGKSQTGAAVGCYFAENVDAPNNVLAIANKKEQAEDRIYRSMKASIKALGGSVPTAVNSKPVMTLPNGTTIRALPNAPSTEAGDRYCLTLWTEIWAFKSASDEQLFAELMPVETERVSMRWIETYAGYWDESETLKRLYLKAWTNTDEKQLAEGAQYVEELADITTDHRPACVEVPEEELFIFWDHERRMPWQTEQAYRREMKSLTKTEGLRLMQNRWQSSASDLLEPAWIEAARVSDEWLKQFEGKPLTFAVDAAMRHDNIAIVGSDKIGEIYVTPFIELHDPEGHDADLFELVEKRIKMLFDENLIKPLWDESLGKVTYPVYFDPFQLHQIRLNCIAYGIDVIEFSQGELRTKADTMLYHLYKDGNIKNPSGRHDFEEHLLGGKAKYAEGEKLRIVKGTTTDSKKNDGLIAQSMSCYGAFLAEEAEKNRDDGQSLLILGSTKNGWFE